MERFEVVRLKDGLNKKQIEQFVAMMGRMYEYHAGLHPDWQAKGDWQKGSAAWIGKASTGEEWFFALVYLQTRETSRSAVGYIIAGFHYEAPLFVHNRYGYIADMWVEPETRGTGAADALLDAAYDFFKVQGVRRVQLEVMVNNDAGRRFWDKKKFEPFEIVMRKDLD